MAKKKSKNKGKPEREQFDEEILTWASFYPAPLPLLLCPECMLCYPFSEDGASDFSKHYLEEHE